MHALCGGITKTHTQKENCWGNDKCCKWGTSGGEPESRHLKNHLITLFMWQPTSCSVNT